MIDGERKKAVREVCMVKGKDVPEDLAQRSWRTDIKLVAIVVDVVLK